MHRASPCRSAWPCVLQHNAKKKEKLCHAGSLGILPQMPQTEHGLLIEALHGDGVQEHRLRYITGEGLSVFSKLPLL